MKSNMKDFIDRVTSGKWTVCADTDEIKISIDNATVVKDEYDSQITIRDSVKGSSSVMLIEVSEIVFVNGNNEFNLKVGNVDVSFDESIF